MTHPLSAPAHPRYTFWPVPKYTRFSQSYTICYLFCIQEGGVTHYQVIAQILSSHTKWWYQKRLQSKRLHWTAKISFSILKFLLVLLRGWPIWDLSNDMMALLFKARLPDKGGTNLEIPPSISAIIAKWNKDLFANRNLPFSTTGGPFKFWGVERGSLGDLRNMYPTKRLAEKKFSHISQRIGVVLCTVETLHMTFWNRSLLGLISSVA